MLTFIHNTVHDRDDQEFMLWLYQNYRTLLEAAARKYVFKPENREDIIQDSIVRLISNVETLRKLSRHALASYIVSTVRSVAYDALRKNAVKEAHIVSLDSPNTSELESSEIQLETLIELSEQRDVLLRVWNNLSEREQILLQGKYILGYSDSELASVVGCEVSSIRMMLTRARRHAFQLALYNEGGQGYDSKRAT